MKKKILILLITGLLSSCGVNRHVDETHKKIEPTSIIVQKTLAEDLNESVVDGFFDGDPKNVPDGVFMLK